MKADVENAQMRKMELCKVLGIIDVESETT